ncbi:MAG TPA: hypothetical protein VGM25_04755 [Caulobacteraceae bacterium]
MRKVLLAAVAAMSVPALAGAQIVYTGPGTYSQVGAVIVGPDGATQQTTGGTAVVTPGGPPYGGDRQQSRTYRKLGGTIVSSDGTTYSRVGGVTIGSDGSRSQTVGNTTVITGPDGEVVTCVRTGSQTNCN